MDVRFADLKAIEYAGMAEQADATDLKSVDFESCGFKSHYPHFKFTHCGQTYSFPIPLAGFSKGLSLFHRTARSGHDEMLKAFRNFSKNSQFIL